MQARRSAAKSKHKGKTRRRVTRLRGRVEGAPSDEALKSFADFLLKRIADKEETKQFEESMDDQLERAVHVLREWASSRSFVKRLWIFGSRVKGEATPNSDLDVAIEINRVGNDEDPLTSFISEASAWRAELQPLLPYQLQLEWYDPLNKRVLKGVRAANYLVYERSR